MTQWHPIFAQLLRPSVENYYDVQTTLPVGDAPREADFVLLRRMGRSAPPFRGLWRHLTAWNILEFKGPTVSPRPGDIELLVELGLGIDRRLRSQHDRVGQHHVPPQEVSFWYLANRLGRRFRGAQAKLGGLEPLGPGLWRCPLLQRLVLLVSSVDLPVEPDSLPLHIVGQEPLATERQVAQLVAEQPALQQLYGGWVASLHPEAWKEAELMARTTGKRLKFDIRPAIESLGWEEVLRQVGVAHVIEQVGMDRLLKEVGVDRVIEQVGVSQVIEQVGVDRVIQELKERKSLKRLVANLSAAERKELKALL